MFKKTLFLAFLLSLLAGRSASALMPAWEKEFRMGALKIMQIVPGNTYQYPQPDLKILETKGRGDCVAWSKFMAKIAFKYKMEFKHYIIAENPDSSGRLLECHQITILKDNSGQLWLQSNENLSRVVDMKEVLERVAIGEVWSNGCHVAAEFTVKEEDLYDN